MEELKAKEEEDRKRKLMITKKFVSPILKNKKKDGKKSEKSDSDNDREDDSPSGKKRKGNKREGHLMERGAKPKRDKIIPENVKEEKLK